MPSSLCQFLTPEQEYIDWLNDIKQKVNTARQQAVLAANAELIILYWQIGQKIIEQQQHNWGNKVIERLSRDLKFAFPEIKGFSVRNLNYMQRFASQYSEFEFVQQVAAKLPWFHICTIMSKIKDIDLQQWYMQQAIDQGWSRSTLEVKIKNELHKRQGQAITNFHKILPNTTSQLAQESLKDPYLFDFLNLDDDANEREIEQGLIQHITHFLLELGQGFAFVGRQFRLEVGGDEFFIDLMFYHIRLKCYVVVELKTTAFKPEHAGQLNFYLAAVDAQIKQPEDNPTIGLLLCKTKNRLVAEYALSGIDKPMGVAEYELVQYLPSIEQLEQELN